jgi:hypothetical protein
MKEALYYITHTVYHSIGEEHRLKVLEDVVLRRIIAPKMCVK